MSTYLSLGALGVGQNLLSGMRNPNDQLEALYMSYIICTFILCQSDFKIVFFTIFPMFVVADVILNLKGKSRQQEVIDALPEKYHSLIEPFDAF
jgi:ABC-type multidrug transport system fused ATPase/permease subunit